MREAEGHHGVTSPSLFLCPATALVFLILAPLHVVFLPQILFANKEEPK